MFLCPHPWERIMKPKVGGGGPLPYTTRIPMKVVVEPYLHPTRNRESSAFSLGVPYPPSRRLPIPEGGGGPRSHKVAWGLTRAGLARRLVGFVQSFAVQLSSVFSPKP